ncbi:MAG: NAD(P)H-dependent oxidoreductase [Bacteroides sp.]|jgi:nitroreductase|nr:NAD(P)H-dependent oxidoreductase [Bacteroides sp.]
MNTKVQEITEAFKFRHACKLFDKNRVIPEETFNMILEAGRLSPSSFGLEPWKFLIVQSKELREKLYPISWGAQNSLDGASHFVIILARKKIDTLYDSEYVNHILTDIKGFSPDVTEQFLKAYELFQKEGFKLLEGDRAIFDWASKQTYIALANMLTVAAMLGVDSCPIEGFVPEPINKLLEDEGIIDGKHFGVSVMAGFGYRAEEPHHPQTRQAAKDVIQWIK